ncbi:glycine cleavage system aminomethyltransferase GcvT [Georgenia sp. TF02-10]|uniref:glycine cleavage system aminomethyltransferase GcvT n=1 Tax=Georgenia sp. TF02-10 TaxID=2917725 RepID=UPI001FA7669D|nr:glycine cleavage system aminomethyltransferase GcvT [Georgenia sp. TF02-10]UNX53398.1 glycine cleavage system aminomethyltransferase GcvT [Georgenia sp. TF02-10]
MAPATTALHAEHVALGATMTTFAGWSMPLRYTSDLAEHAAVRERAGLFDLSHMGQIEVSGPGAAAALDRALVTVSSTLPVGRARYSLLTDADGGILDDLIVYRLAEAEFLIVANAANRLRVLDEVTGRATADGARAGVHVADRTEARALIALQGPAAPGVLAALTDADVPALRYYRVTTATVAGTPVLLARTGYTGEVGYELSVPASSAVGLWRALLEAGRAAGVQPCGLAARDTLRLEAGMPLYGHELTTATTPYDVGLGRLVDLDHDFVGRDALARRAEEPARTALVGLAGTGRRAARAGAILHDGDAQVGTVTSGVLSPTLAHPVALAHVDPAAAAVGTVLAADVRGTRQPMTVVDLPFYRRPARPPAPSDRQPSPAAAPPEENR